MQLLLTIPDPIKSLPASAMREKRITARAVLMDAVGNIALMYVGSKNYHKLPGGGVEGDETLEEGLARELQEETGCAAEILNPLGITEEFRDKWNLQQTSHGYLARLVGAKGTPQFEPSEIADNFALKWLPLTEAIALLATETENPDYEAYFINRRETAFLRAAQVII